MTQGRLFITVSKFTVKINGKCTGFHSPAEDVHKHYIARVPPETREKINREALLKWKKILQALPDSQVEEYMKSVNCPCDARAYQSVSILSRSCPPSRQNVLRQFPVRRLSETEGIRSGFGTVEGHNSTAKRLVYNKQTDLPDVSQLTKNAPKTNRKDPETVLPVSLQSLRALRREVDKSVPCRVEIDCDESVSNLEDLYLSQNDFTEQDSFAGFRTDKRSHHTKKYSRTTLDGTEMAAETSKMWYTEALEPERIGSVFEEGDNDSRLSASNRMGGTSSKKAAPQVLTVGNRDGETHTNTDVSSLTTLSVSRNVHNEQSSSSKNINANIKPKPSNFNESYSLTEILSDWEMDTEVIAEDSMLANESQTDVLARSHLSTKQSKESQTLEQTAHQEICSPRKPSSENLEGFKTSGNAASAEKSGRSGVMSHATVTNFASEKRSHFLDPKNLAIGETSSPKKHAGISPSKLEGVAAILAVWDAEEAEEAAMNGSTTVRSEPVIEPPKREYVLSKSVRQYLETLKENPALSSSETSDGSCDEEINVVNTCVISGETRPETGTEVGDVTRETDDASSKAARSSSPPMRRTRSSYIKDASSSKTVSWQERGQSEEVHSSILRRMNEKTPLSGSAQRSLQALSEKTKKRDQSSGGSFENSGHRLVHSESKSRRDGRQNQKRKIAKDLSKQDAKRRKTS